MKILKSVEFREVLEVFNKEHDRSRAREWTPKLLEHANLFYSGKWSLVELSAREVKTKVTLMWHKDGELELIPKEGATVVETAEKLLCIGEQYRNKNKSCFDRIQELKTAEFNAVFLASQYPKGYKILQHELVNPPEGNYFHLDGTHRMIAWYLAGRFNLFRYFLGKKLTAYVVGEL